MIDIGLDLSIVGIITEIITPAIPVVTTDSGVALITTDSGSIQITTGA